MPPRRFYVRADASALVGTGHVMRCLSLAGELRARGAEVRFLSRPGPHSLCELIEASFPLHRLAEARSVDEDAAQTRALVPPGAFVLVDNYGLDAHWEEQVDRPVVAIDDLGRAHRCRLLIDANYHSEPERRYEGKLPASCRRLLGPAYALLRPEFRALRDSLGARTGELRRVLATFGGADPTREAFKAVAALARFPELEVEVLSGASNPAHDELAALVARHPTMRCERFTPALAEALARCDLCLGAGGSTTWERCCLGVPTLCIAVAENQRETSKQLGLEGYQVYLGTSEEVTVDRLAAGVHRLLASAAEVRALSSRSLALVDGAGAGRVAAAMLEERGA